jgi:non-ribosomal peptide synthetase component F
MDGWCLAPLVKEIITIYNALVQKHPFNLEPAYPYRDFIQWLLQQDKEKAKNFWQQELNGFHTVTHVTHSTSLPASSHYHLYEIELPGQLFNGLRVLAQAHALTLSTLVQGAWSILLSRYSGSLDVMYGTIVSGRPPAMRGIESMIGLFINTLPVRVQVNDETFLLPWLQEFQAKQAEREEYAYSSIIDIQAWSNISRDTPLFDHLLVFENYPVDDSLYTGIKAMTFTDVAFFEQHHYPLTLIFLPGKSLALKIYYDCNCFSRTASKRTANQFQFLLEGFVKDPERPISAYSLPTEPEKQGVSGKNYCQAINKIKKNKIGGKQNV